MITGLDHVVLVLPSIGAAEEAYASLLGREPDWRGEDGAGAAHVIFQLENTAVEIMAPHGEGPLASRLQGMVEAGGAGLASLVFATGDLAGAHAVCERRALGPGAITHGESLEAASGRRRSLSRFRLDDGATHGVRIFLLQRGADDPLLCRPAGPEAVGALDHVVINTPDPDRAAGLYGARLGLRLALDRASREWDMRLMFFRTGGLTVELAHRLSAGLARGPDRLWGLSWRVGDIEAAHARLGSGGSRRNGFELSAIRTGRKAGSRVFTVRSEALGAPTLFIGQ